MTLIVCTGSDSQGFGWVGTGQLWAHGAIIDPRYAAQHVPSSSSSSSSSSSASGNESAPAAPAVIPAPFSFEAPASAAAAPAASTIRGGCEFRTGDVIGCTLDMDRRTLAYRKNGKPLGIGTFDAICDTIN
jgi:hypothetical protein